MNFPKKASILLLQGYLLDILQAESWCRLLQSVSAVELCLARLVERRFCCQSAPGGNGLLLSLKADTRPTEDRRLSWPGKAASIWLFVCR